MESKEYLLASREFLFEVLDAEIDVLESWKVRPESFSRNVPLEFSKYDLTNDDLLTLSYGSSISSVVEDNLASSKQSCAVERSKLKNLTKLYQSGVDEYLSVVMEKSPLSVQRRFLQYNRPNDDLDINNISLASSAANESENPVQAIPSSPSDSVLNHAVMTGKSLKWKTLSRQEADEKLYGDTHHPNRDMSDKRLAGTAATQNVSSSEKRDKLGAKPYWVKITGCVDNDLLVGTTAERILAHHQKLVSLSKIPTLSVKAKSPAKSVAAGSDDQKQSSTMGELDRSYVPGPVVSVLFKPPFWRQFDSTTQGQQKMDVLRKEALKQRHMSTYVVGSGAAGMKDESIVETSKPTRESLFSTPASKSAGSGTKVSPIAEHQMASDRKAVSFSDLIKSMSTFYHLSNADIAKLETKCSLVHFVDGELVLTEGDLSASAYIMSAGTMTVQRDNQQLLGVKDVLGSLTMGDVFGDTSYSTNAAARVCKNTYISIGDNVSAYAMTGDTYRKYAYKLNKDFVPPIDASRKEVKNSSRLALTGANVISYNKEDLSLSSHIESYAEFLLFFRSSSAAALFDGSLDHIIPNTAKLEADEVDESEPTGSFRTAGKGKARARSSISALLDKAANKTPSISTAHANKLRQSFEQRSSKMNANGSSMDINNEDDGVDHFANIFGETDPSEGDDESSHASRVADADAAQRAVDDRVRDIVESRRRLVLAMMGTASPELELPETLEVLLKLIKELFDVDRVGVFVVDKVKNAMTLFMSQYDRMAKKAITEPEKSGNTADVNIASPNQEETDKPQTLEALYVQVPLKGIAGHIAKTGEIVVLPDCYEHPLFDSHMDEVTGYRTKQLLCVPCFDRATEGSVVGVLQCINPCSSTSAFKRIETEDRKSHMQAANKNDKNNTKKSTGKNAVTADPKSKTTRRFGVALESDSSESEEELTITTAADIEVVDASSRAKSIAKNGGKADFTKTDEMLAVMISQLVGSVIGQHKNRAVIEVGGKANASMAINTPSSFIRKPVGLRLNKLVFNVPSAGSNGAAPSVDLSDELRFPPTVKCTVTIYDGINQVGEAQYSQKITRDMTSRLDNTQHAAESEANTSTTSKNTRTRHSKKSIPFEKTLDGTVMVWEINESLEFSDVWIRNLPLSSRAIVQFYGPKGRAIGWCAVNLFNFDKELCTGRRVCRLWEGSCDSPIQACSWPERSDVNSPHPADGSAITDKYIQFEFKSFDRPILFAPSLVNKNANKQDQDAELTLRQRIDKLADKEYYRFSVVSAISRGYTSEPLRNLTPDDKAIVWSLRHSMVHYPSLLPAFLLSVPWAVSECAFEAYRLMSEWKVTSYASHHGHSHHGNVNDNNSSHNITTRTCALTLLYGTAFPDPKVRAYAVITMLKFLSDRDLSAILLPLVVALKYERYVDNALTRFLLRRAIENPSEIGTPMYWHLKSQLDILSAGPEGSHNPSIMQRYETIAQLYMRKSGSSVRTALGHTEAVHRRLADVARRILDSSVQHVEELSQESRTNFGYGTGNGIGTGDKQDISSDKGEVRRRILVNELRKLQLPSSFDFPGDTKYRVNILELKDCAYQKTWPHKSLKLVFSVDQGEAVQKRIKKSLNKCVLWARVDVDPYPEKIALTMLQAIDSLWRTFGLEMHVVTYNCLHQDFPVVPGEGEDKQTEKTKFSSSLFGVPMHAKTFQELLVDHSKFDEANAVRTKTEGFFGKLASSFGNGANKGPKEYVSLSGRVFPGDILENWLCMRNFEYSSSYQDNLYVPNPKVHATVFEKYYNKTAFARRGNLLGVPSLSATVPNPNGGPAIQLYEPNPITYEWRLRYARSLAGWYVSSYVLHVNNRSADNILFLPTGEVFNFELNCLNLEERIAKMNTITERKVSDSYSPRPPASTVTTNKSDSVNLRHSAPATVNSGYASLEKLHQDATAHLLQMSDPNDPETKKLAKNRAKQVLLATGASASQSGISTGSYSQQSYDKQERTRVPLLPCFLRVLGPIGGSVFSYFKEYALNAFTVLRSHPEFLMQTLKASLLSVPAFGTSEDSETAIAQVVEALMANLMLEMEVDEEAARARFLLHMQFDMQSYSATAGKDSYPASANFTDKE